MAVSGGGHRGTPMIPAGRRVYRKTERNADECPVCRAGKRSPCQDYEAIPGGRGKVRVVIRAETHRTEAARRGVAPGETVPEDT